MHEFKPISKKTISQEIVEQVLSLIRTNSFKPGDKLPSEKDLCRAFNVGISSVREAMKILKTTGLIRAANKGKVILAAESTDRPVLMLDDDGTNIHEVFEARKLIEIELSALAAMRATSEDIKKMKQILAEMTNLQSATIAGDISFHRALVNSVHNSVFGDIYNSITGLLFQHFKYYSFIFDDGRHTEDYTKEIVEDHLRILTAIESGDCESAKQAMREHLDNAERKLLASLEAKVRKMDPIPSGFQVKS